MVQGGQIYVPRGQQAKYMGALADAKALPPNYGMRFKEAVDNSNPFSSQEERNNRWIVARQQELKNILSNMQGIEQGYVIFDSAVTPGLKREKLTTALAVVKPIGSQELDEEKVASIRMAVKAAFAGLDIKNVTVSDQNGHTWSGDPDNGAAGENKYVQTLRTYEKNLRNDIKNCLSYIPGVTVTTKVVLDPNETTHTTEIEHEKPLAISESESTTQRVANQRRQRRNGGIQRQHGQPGRVSKQGNVRRIERRGKHLEDRIAEHSVRQADRHREAGPDSDLGNRVGRHSGKLLQESVAVGESAAGRAGAERSRHRRARANENQDHRESQETGGETPDSAGRQYRPVGVGRSDRFSRNPRRHAARAFDGQERRWLGSAIIGAWRA